MIIQQLIELVKSGNNNNTINNTTINCNNNNTFNLQVFLNETCKDAMNIEDFLESIVVTIPDLKKLAKFGYVEGISGLLIKNLNDIDITKRPLHCSDVKRETVYIKENDKWGKDSEQKERLKKVIRELSKLHTRALTGQYKDTFPQCMTDYNSKEHDEYGKIAYEAFGGSCKNPEAQNRSVIRKIVNQIKIEKELEDQYKL